MRDRARVVIIGGGVGGTSIAYHLAQLGERDVLLVERAQLTSGSTFHSAGLVGQLRSSVTLTRMMMHGADLYPRLHELTGHDPGWHRVGSLRLASTPERMEELSRQAGWAKTFGLPLELVSTAEALELFAGLFDPTDVLGAVYLPTDGWLNPSDLTMAFAAGARAGGVEIAQGVRVTAIGVDGGRVTSVDTDRGRVECEVVVNAAGMYAWEVGRLAGVHVPLAPFAHQYVITRPRAEVPRSLPTMRDPDRLVYFREEVGGLLMGGYERNPAPWGLFGIPADFNNRLLDFDWDRFLPLTESATTLVPVLADAEVTHVINGPEAFTPDGEFLLGETEVRGFFVAAGFCAHGIAGAAGVGKVTAEWIVAGEPQADLWKMDVRRFGPHHRDRRYVLDRTTEIYATYYDITYPNHERASGRPLRVPPAYTRHLALDADMGEKAGWERVNWYRSNENPAHEHLRPRGWAGRNWSTAIVTEVFATRECAGLFDESSFAKIEVSGPGALAYLRRLCANDVDKPVGSIVYTAALNRRGGIECDFTVTRLEADRFLIVTGTAFGQHDLAWVGANAPSDVWVRDVTSALACFALWGPRAREVLANACDDDLSFGYLQARQLAVAGVPCTALRVTYVGEMGWELYSPTEYGLRLWDALMEAGGPLGLRPAGYRAIDAMRLEKGYRVWGSDITNERDPFSAGLGFAVRMRDRDFNGRDALAALDRERLPQRLCCLVLDDARAVAVGNEPVSAHGSVVGRVTSGGVGYWLGCSIAYAWLPGDVAIPGSRVSVEVFGEVVGA
ncbi:MAG TPA: FAD-dependent oxidoreductase, partial [Acidimicrobiales bacterium]